MIKINYIGRLGNNIFQYCFGRIIAEELKYSIDRNLDLFENAIKINGLNFSYDRVLASKR